MPLTDLVVKRATFQEKPFKLADERGLYLLVTAAGKYWRLDYRFLNKRKTLALGVYPDVGLAQARTKRDNARQLIANGVDPGLHKKLQKTAALQSSANSFEIIAREWFTKNVNSWVESHSSKILRRLEKDVFPWIGNRAIAEITAVELLPVFRRIEQRGAIETAHRALQSCNAIFRYAVVTGRTVNNPATDLRGALSTVKATHHASITDIREIGALLRAIAGYSGTFVTKCALQFAPLVFVRPGELRNAEWREFDLESKEWRIPAERMKMREQHIVPLSRQASKILEELRPLTGESKYVFPGTRTSSRPMSENTINAALRRMGYTSDEMTGHGFRSMASTLLNEQGWNRDAIERQLAHAERDAVRAAYNYAEHLPERRKMMQHWADFLDTLIEKQPSGIKLVA